MYPQKSIVYQIDNYYYASLTQKYEKSATD